MECSFEASPGMAVTAQLVYLALSVVATLYVGRTLHRHGRIFLVDAFGGNAPLADSVNHLLVVGFYLVNVGFVCQTITDNSSVRSWGEVIQRVSGQFGTVLLVLGGMHFFNLFVFSRIRRRGLLRTQPPPVLPTQVLGAARTA